MMLKQYEELTNQAQEAIVSGDLEAACSLLAQAEAVATEVGQTELADLAFCRRCLPLHELDRLGDAGEIVRLKAIMLRSAEPKTRWLAAFYTAAAYNAGGDREKAEAYTARAIAFADQLGEPLNIAVTANLSGMLDLVASRFDDARFHFERALALYQAQGDYHELMTAQVQDNLGYALICIGQVDRGIDLCELARDTMDRLEALHYLHEPLQDLCYGYMLTDRLKEASESGERGLELALAIDDRLVIKNLHYLLAEVAVRNGDRFRARRFLNDLATCYPELPYSEEIVDLLMETDFSMVVNLRG